MDCDALKKALLKDEDGTLLGQPGAVIPQSEYEWDANPVRGLGDYRIPTAMLSTPSGDRIAASTKAPHKGILRDDSCVYMPSYQAYVCHSLDYEMLIVESLDKDTETRRVSPVAVWSAGYVDLINGPQDHGWCFGYTCQRRLSTFPVIVATGHSYELFFTGTTPQNLRLHLLNSVDSQAVAVAVWYAQSWRLDVHVDDDYVLPENGASDAAGRVTLSPPTSPGQYVPDVAIASAGVNYFDRDTGLLHVVVRGPTPVDIITTPLIVVSFSLPAMTEDEFFGENIVNNLALFLDVPPHKIRIASSVRETARRRRNTSPLVLSLEIGNAPGAYSSSSDLSLQRLQEMSSQIVTAYQMQTLGGVLNVTILSMAIVQPPPAPGSDEWAVMTNTGSPALSTPAIIGSLYVITQPALAVEGEAFGVQPVVGFLDTEENLIAVGTITDPWVVTATLHLVQGSQPGARLQGSTTATVVGVRARFSTLAISLPGTYIVDFRVSSPALASGLQTMSTLVTVTLATLSAIVIAQPNVTSTSQPFMIKLQIVDSFTQKDLVDPKGSVSATCSISNLIEVIEAGQDMLPRDVKKSVELTFDEDYNSTVLGHEKYFVTVLHNELAGRYPNVLFSNFETREGSIEVSFYVEGRQSAVSSALNALWTRLEEGFTLQFDGRNLTARKEMLVDNEPFYGTSSRLAAELIAIAVLLPLLALGLVLLIVYKNCKAGKASRISPIEKAHSYKLSEKQNVRVSTGQRGQRGRPKSGKPQLITIRKYSTGSTRPVSALRDATIQAEAPPADDKRYSNMFINPDSKWSKTVFRSTDDIDSDAASTGVVDV
ncbi:Fibrocystin-L [Lamellibrachia satsuma]|nr:Fibrocystin-L [Lamellibrachia satsuma]